MVRRDTTHTNCLYRQLKQARDPEKRGKGEIMVCSKGSRKKPFADIPLCPVKYPENPKTRQFVGRCGQHGVL